MEGRFSRVHCSGHGEWLEERLKRIQASEAAAVLGLSPWTSSAELYDLKTGRAQPKDISKKPYIIYGHEAERPIREMFLLDNPYFQSEYYPYDILVSKTAPFLGATLDGELEVVSDDNPWGLRAGTHGIYEGKTGTFRKEGDLAAWNGRDSYIPPHYYSQVLHQLLVTGWDFVILNARLRRMPFCESDGGFPEIRCFTRMVERTDPQVRNDMMTLYKAEKRFWLSVEERRRPSRRLAI